MTDSTNKPTTAFWIISIIALIWNLMGVNAYIQQAYNTESHQAMFPDPKQLEIVNNLPAWLTAVFAIAVFAGALGCLFLLLRKKLAKSLLMLSLLAVIIQTVYNVFINEGKEFYEAFQNIMLIMIPLLSIFLVWYSKDVAKKGWLS